MSGFLRCMSLIFAAALSCAATGGARAQGGVENFEIGLSTETIGITSNFAGERLVVFGVLDNADARIRQQQRYDIVVAMVGPRRPAVVRRKERTLGIWINSGSETFENPPTSYALASTRPLRDIAPAPLRATLSIGIDDLRFNEGIPQQEEQATAPAGAGASATATDEADLPTVSMPDEARVEAVALANRDEYAEALRRIRTETGLFNETFGTVRFVSPTLFRADLQLPADLPVGRHMVRAYLFRNGVFIREATETLTVVKTGFESFVSDFARDHALTFGIFAVVLAILTGWFGRLVFKRD